MRHLALAALALSLGTAALGADRLGPADARPLEPLALPPSAAEGWSMAAAVRAVVLSQPKSAVPDGVSAPGLAAVPADSALWARAAERLRGDGTYRNGLVEDGGHVFDGAAFAKRALADAGRDAEDGLAAALLETGDARTRALTAWAPLAPLLSASSRRRLKAGLRAAGADPTAAMRATMPPGAAVAAASVDPRLVVSQFRTQHNKTRGRRLEDYNDLLALRKYAPLAGLPASESLNALLSDDPPLNGLLERLRGRFGSVHWADVGAGVGRALRDWSAQRRGEGVRRTLVDLFDWENAAPRHFGHSRFDSSGMEREHRPAVKLASAETVSFGSDRPHLITSVSSVIYWHDKLRGIANLYNQLADDGILVVEATMWARGMIEPFGQDGSRDALKEFVETLARSGIEVLPLGWKNDGPDLTMLVLRKKPGTRVVVAAPPPRIRTDQMGFVTSSYRWSGEIARVERAD